MFLGLLLRERSELNCDGVGFIRVPRRAASWFIGSFVRVPTDIVIAGESEFEDCFTCAALVLRYAHNGASLTDVQYIHRVCIVRWHTLYEGVHLLQWNTFASHASCFVGISIAGFVHRCCVAVL